MPLRGMCSPPAGSSLQSARRGRSYGRAHPSSRKAASACSTNSRTWSARKRSTRATSAVVQLPSRIQITFGGGPRITLNRWKSSSLVTSTNCSAPALLRRVRTPGCAWSPVEVREVVSEAHREVLIEQQLHGAECRARPAQMPGTLASRRLRSVLAHPAGQGGEHVAHRDARPSDGRLSEAALGIDNDVLAIVHAKRLSVPEGSVKPTGKFEGCWVSGVGLAVIARARRARGDPVNPMPARHDDTMAIMPEPHLLSSGGKAGPSVSRAGLGSRDRHGSPVARKRSRRGDAGPRDDGHFTLRTSNFKLPSPFELQTSNFELPNAPGTQKGPGRCARTLPGHAVPKDSVELNLTGW